MRVDKYIALSLTVLLFATMGLAGCGTQEKPAAATEKYPNKPITIIVPFAAGGGIDMMARSLEKVAPKYLGQPLVVTNIPGGAATIGMNELAGSKADGYTLGMTSIGVVLQPLYGETRYHYSTALEPLVQVTSTPTIAVVRADQPWENMQELVEYARKNPGKIKFGHSGLGTGNHVAGEMLASKSGVVMEQVPFRGDSEILAALLGDHIKLMYAFLPSVREHVKSGKVKIVGVAAEARSTDPVLANVPTFKEQGIDVTFGVWHAIAVPKGIPAAEKKKLIEGLQGMINDPEYKKDMEGLGMPVDYLDNSSFTQKWLDETVKLTSVVKETGIAEKIAAQKK